MMNNQNQKSHKISFKDGILKVNEEVIENYSVLEKKGKYYIDICHVLQSLRQKYGDKRES